MTRIALALTFPLRYYAYLTTPARHVAAAPIEAPAGVTEPPARVPARLAA